MGRYGYLIVFIAVLGIPLLTRAFRGGEQGSASTGTSERLVIITPHQQEIRNEFRWAFADWHRRKYGTPVNLEFITPGGTLDIRRQLDTIYRAVRNAHGGQLPPEEQMNSGSNIVGIDIVWGGGDYEFNSKLKPLGILHPMDLSPKFLAEVYPDPTLGGVKLYDQDRDKSGHLLPLKWVGICLSSFGIVYNPDLYQAMDLQPPRTWRDLTEPKLYRSLSLADPTHSGSAAVAYMMVIQRAMADAETAFLKRPENVGKKLAALKSTPAYKTAIDAGWKEGMRQLVLIAANARFFTDSSTEPPNTVATGDAAAGIAIDFYGRVTEQAVGPDRERFILPAAATAITPDPAAILYGTHGRQLELANHFIEFLLSPEGQRLWILKPGVPGGPRVFALRRMPVRRSVYADRTNWTDDIDYFASAGGFNQRGEWLGTFSELPQIWGAAWIDTGDILRNAAGRISQVSDPARRAELFARLSDIPIMRADVTSEIAEGARVAADPSQDSEIWKARKRLSWSRKFAQHYEQVAQEADDGK